MDFNLKTTVTSPLPERRLLGNPLPLIDTVSPGIDPFGTLIFKFSPSIWGNSSSHPSVKSTKLIGKAINRSLPSLSNHSWALWDISMYKCPEGPLASLDASPYPLILNRVPDSIPGGIENLTFLFLFKRPFPLQEVQLLTIVFPFPLQAGQSETTCWVNGPTLCILLSRPWPSQVAQTSTSSGVRAPEPSHDSQTDMTSISISASKPENASSNDIECLYRRSDPLSAPRDLRLPKILPKILSKPPPNRSSMLMSTPWNPSGPNGFPPGLL